MSHSTSAIHSHSRRRFSASLLSLSPSTLCRIPNPDSDHEFSNPFHRSTVERGRIDMREAWRVLCAAKKSRKPSKCRKHDRKSIGYIRKRLDRSKNAFTHLSAKNELYVVEYNSICNRNFIMKIILQRK